MSLSKSVPHVPEYTPEQIEMAICKLRKDPIKFARLKELLYSEPVSKLLSSMPKALASNTRISRASGGR